MRWITTATLALGLTVPFSTYATAADWRRYEASARGSLTLETDGSVGEVVLPDELESPFREAYLATIKAWKFQPVSVDGEAVRARGDMQLNLFLETDGASGLRAGIEDVTFLDPPGVDGPATAAARGRLTPPRYPPRLAREGIGGRVNLRLEVDASGKVLNAGVVSGGLFSLQRRVDQNVTRGFEALAESAVRAAREWQVVAPRGETQVTVPVVFTFGDQTKAFWKPLLLVPVTPEPWMMAGDASRHRLTASGETPSETIRPLQPVEGAVVIDSAATSGS